MQIRHRRFDSDQRTPSRVKNGDVGTALWSPQPAANRIRFDNAIKVYDMLSDADRSKTLIALSFRKRLRAKDLQRSMTEPLILQGGTSGPATAADCKSAIVGSTPTSASSKKPRFPQGIRGFLMRWRDFLRPATACPN